MIRSLPRWLLTAALPLALCATAEAQTPTLRIQDYPGIIGTLARVAVEKGYCAKNGIQCTLTTIPAAPLGVQTLMAGGIEVALPPSEVAIQSAAKGADLKIVGGMFDASPFMLIVGPGLLASAGKGYPAIMQDLKGKKIGVTSRGAAPEFQIKSMLLQAGLKEDDVTFVAVGSPNTGYPALLNKQVDAVMSFIPFDGFCDVLKTCRIAVLPAKGEGPKVLTDLNGAGGLYVMRRDYTQKNPATVEAFVKALNEAERFTADPANGAELLQITLKYYRIEMPKGDEILKSSLDRFRANMIVKVKKPAVQAAADYLQQTGQLDKSFDAARLF
ncbi:ABC transporter substrate-binding protein [Variovorax sp. PBL-E5]|uniref:ABC transporter substrate-binding protein n=1 Tax=Variovorax sp. PBL-E5 TaxID=434014 RepID=UPI001318A1ED|nr:ABC transporter substrate-binding protein [Variovorax sp. PBL-E5]VTU38414.1 Putative aliphatic sulfonates-binding protein precursor [Variovorax sp. PBL-E5]